MLGTHWVIATSEVFFIVFMTSIESDIPATIVMNTIKNTSDVAITQWVPNKIYTYNIAINPVGKEILLNPIVETEWSFEEDINVTVE